MTPFAELGLVHERSPVIGSRWLEASCSRLPVILATELPCPRGGDTTKHENGHPVAGIYKATGLGPLRINWWGAVLRCAALQTINVEIYVFAVCHIALTDMTIFDLTAS